MLPHLENSKKKNPCSTGRDHYRDIPETDTQTGESERQEFCRSVCEYISSFFGVLMAAEPLTELEAAIGTIMDRLHTYALIEDQGFYLSFKVFKILVNHELPHILKDVGSLDEKMKSLDVNQDSKLNFNECWRLMGELAKPMWEEKVLEVLKK
ncbi:protein S100-A13-like isoform X2 [Meriones unguiculatus]|uniref:protein S100-A13-like isoform X2 n=1 Tax=Meriones unguiculatus TaxID=10047 RepID=UPI000B4F4EE1|nr:protein S100-A13-like isoform X2 [Meriones unguiculatus]